MNVAHTHLWAAVPQPCPLCLAGIVDGHGMPPNIVDPAVAAALALHSHIIEHASVDGLVIFRLRCARSAGAR